MNIEEMVARKLKISSIIGLPLWIGFVISVESAPEDQFNWVSMLFFVLMGVTIIYQMYFIKCPRCSAHLGRASMAANGTFNRKKKIKYCPECGVSLEEQV